MIYKNIKREFDYIIWLRERIKTLRFGITRKIKTDSTTDFELLVRKLKSYQEEYSSVVEELYSLLKDGYLSEQVNNIREESGALPIRDAYSCWPKKEKEENSQAPNERRDNPASQRE
ncbi:hypothetical protein JXE04_02250 [Patescibacteria group bacterium]|nr:hypothetical protein [Patescibacteria group bacterium]